MNHILRMPLFLAVLMYYLPVISHAEFLYPVGAVVFEGSERIAVLYQQSSHLELWLWDPATKHAIKGLSHYTPAGLTILPSHTQFSFIDHERIRIKTVAKKSPKALDMYPLYDFGIIYWIDDENGYCSARERHHYNLFHITTDGDLYRLTRSSTYDYTYPQKVGSDLFYIKRNDKGVFSIEKTMYPTTEISTCQADMHNLKDTLSLETIELANQDTPRACLSVGNTETLFTCNEYDQALTFLSMKTAEEGFFLKHIDHPFIERFEKVMVFECWHLIKKETWKTKKLFEFTIPLSFFYGERRLYESVLRLLPIYNNDAIFYVSATPEGYLNVYRYSTSKASITCLSQGAQEQYFFTPYFYQGIGYCGGMVKNEENSLAEGPTLQEAENGEQIFIFPTVELTTKKA